MIIVIYSLELGLDYYVVMMLQITSDRYISQEYIHIAY